MKLKFFLEGVREVAPFFIGAIPFGVAAGIYSVEKGFSTLDSFLMSVFIFAGAAQVATVNLLTDNAPFWIVVGTALVINLRFLIFSASVSPYLTKAPSVLRPFMAYFMTDSSFILTARRPNDGVDRTYQFLGISIAIWIVWQTSFLIGANFGNIIPQSWSLEFALPLLFIFFTAPLLNTSPNIVAAITAGISAIIFIPILPLQSGMITSILLGAFAGGIIKKYKLKKAGAS